MKSIPRVNTYWDLVASNLILRRTPVNSDTDDVSVTYSIDHNGSAYLSGSMTWEDLGYENAWVKQFQLPSTPGILIAVVTASGTVDGVSATGTLQASLKVVG